MRFHTTHLLGIVVIAALVFGIMRHPESLFAVLVPLAGGICVVLPVLATLELLTPRDRVHTEAGWFAVVLACIIAVLGTLALVGVGAIILELYW